MQCRRLRYASPRSRDLLLQHHPHHRHILPQHSSVRHGLYDHTLSPCPNRRTFFSHVSAVLPAILVPPVIFLSLGIGLWTWKCMMMVVFQNKIIYMPGLPPNARRERISDYEKQCHGVKWRELRIKCADQTEIALCISATKSCDKSDNPPIYVIYFQGNASSTPPRLPFISPVVRATETENNSGRRCVFVLVSYRGYWTSQGRPNEAGITLDALAALSWVSSQHTSLVRIPVILWGQSIGCGVASTLAANHVSGPYDDRIEIQSIILETPFTNTRDLLATLYPQSWLPYKYLWPFLRNHLDTVRALDRIAASKLLKPEIVIVEAGDDELVPKEHGRMLETKGSELALPIRREVVVGALHTEVSCMPSGRRLIVDAIKTVIDRVHANEDKFNDIK